MQIMLIYHSLEVVYIDTGTDGLKTSALVTRANESFSQIFWKYIKHNYQLIIMLLPGLLMLVLFKIAPIGAMVIAFQDFNAFKGIFNSDWVGFNQFVKIFSEPYMVTLVKNTLLLAFYSLLFSFPIPIIFSLMVNEVKLKRFKGAVQSISFLPYFISSAVMVSILYTMLSPSTGIVNMLMKSAGMDSISFMTEPRWFRTFYVILQIWQTFGYSAVIYLASITSIDPCLYESASIDGATRWHKMSHIILPSISGTIIVMLIISIGNIFTVDLDRILLMYNSSVYETADVIQTYVYRMGFSTISFPDYSYGTAVNMLKSIVAFILVITTNRISKKYSDSPLF